jgi:hypothetical protein
MRYENEKRILFPFSKFFISNEYKLFLNEKLKELYSIKIHNNFLFSKNPQ